MQESHNNTIINRIIKDVGTALQSIKEEMNSDIEKENSITYNCGIVSTSNERIGLFYNNISIKGKYDYNKEEFILV